MQRCHMTDKKESALEDFSNEQVVAALLRSRRIHSGFWSLAVRFGFGAAYAKAPDGLDATAVPAAIVAVGGLALRAVKETDPNAINAAKVNPEPTRGTEEPEVKLPTRKRAKKTISSES